VLTRRTLLTLWGIPDTRARSDRHFEKARRSGGVVPATPRPERESAHASQSTQGSEFGRKVAVDFEADANFHKGWGRPRHGRFPFILIHRCSP
jgi:hypothetical protein